MTGALETYVLLVLVGFLPNEVWRMLGLVFGHGIDEQSELFSWARAVATAVLAGVVAKLLLFPPGALAAVPLAVRLVAIACGLGAFLVVRRSVFAGVLAGEVVLVLGAMAYSGFGL
jgi:Branched-chain amino acid transport protein (AzlD)